MLPQPDPQVLKANPDFARLYKDLAANKLNTDGSSQIIDPKEAKTRDAFATELQNTRVELARKNLLSEGLCHVAYSLGELPDELQDTIRIVLARLEGRLESADDDIVQAETEVFQQEINTIAQPLSDYFQAVTASLATIAVPPQEDQAKNNHDLEDSVASLLEKTSTLETRLHEARISLANETASLLTLHQKAYTIIIRILEQTIHGSVARGTRAHAEYLAQMTQALEQKLRVIEMQTLQQIYTPEVNAALRTKEQELEKEQTALRRQIRELESNLQDYERVKGMKELANTYAEVQRETIRVQADIDRLRNKP
ncbi:hypothetical protein MBLNU457_g2459t1 [Dothideomycetes sp. NU457]